MILSNTWKKIFLILLSLLCYLNIAFAQVPNTQDCLGAIPICQGVYVQNNSFVGTGNFPNEINPNNSCLKSGEKNDVWYVFTVQTSGILNFTITPNSATDDYDWAVYNLTNATCAQIATNPLLEVSCNYSGLAGPTGPNGLPGGQNSPTFAVTAGQTFVLNVSNFSSTQSGYTFDVGATTATIFDDSPPYPKEIVSTPPGSALTCGLSKITLKFSENINCNSLDTNDLAVLCPNNIVHHIGQVQCKSTGNYSNSFDLTLSPALTDSGAHAVYMTRVDPSSITDLCGNPASSDLTAMHDTVPFRVKGLKMQQQKSDVTCFGDTSGMVKLIPSNGTSPYTYSWLVNPVKSTLSISNVRAGTYTCIVKDSKGCSFRDSLKVNEPTPIQPMITASWDTCGKGTAVAIVTAVGGTPSYTFQWDDAYQQITDTAIRLNQGVYSVKITDSKGCDTTMKTIIRTAPIVRPDFDYNPKALSLFFAGCYFKDLSINAVHWFWNFGDGDTSYSQNPLHTFSKDGTFPVKLIIENSYGCEDSVTIEIYVDGFYTLYIPNSFTPNGDGRNDEFTIRGTGLIQDKFDFALYARNGQMIYHTNDLQFKWDGNISGNPVKEDTYVYDIFFTDYKLKEHRKQGMITITR